MPNKNHGLLVKRGAEAIGAWKAKHPKERLDLQGAVLEERASQKQTSVRRGSTGQMAPPNQAPAAIISTGSRVGPGPPSRGATRAGPPAALLFCRIRKGMDRLR